MNQLTSVTINASIAALTIASLLVASYVLVEPTMGRAAATASEVFTITQEITDEISFQAVTDVTMVSSIQGVTGGYATGTTYAVVRSNSNSGYTMDIAFANSPAMRGSSTLSTAIRNFATSSTQTQPSFIFVASTSSQFGYTVAASTTSDLDPSFLNDGTNCNAGAGYTANRCWMTPSTTNYRIIDRDTAANDGATTTLTFHIQVPNNPSPALEEDFYIATATLTATNQ